MGEVVVGFGGGLDHLVVPLLRELAQLRGNLAELEFHALARLIPDDRLHAHEVDDALEVFLGADGNLDRHGIGAQALLHLPIDLEEVGADTVHLVDEGEPRHAVLHGLAPDGLRLGLHAAHRVVHHARAVEHAHGALDLDGEVHVAGRVDDVDAVLGQALVHPLPKAGRRRRSDGDAALALLLHPVHDGRAVVDLAWSWSCRRRCAPRSRCCGSVRWVSCVPRSSLFV